MEGEGGRETGNGCGKGMDPLKRQIESNRRE